jgi:hypothetical protein
MALGCYHRIVAPDARGPLEFGPFGRLLPNGKLSPNLRVLDSWLVEGYAKLLWLPTDYRPTWEAVQGKWVVLGHSSGTISFLQIKQGSGLLISSFAPRSELFKMTPQSFMISLLKEKTKAFEPHAHTLNIEFAVCTPVLVPTP